MPTPPTHIVTLLFRDEAEATAIRASFASCENWTAGFRQARATAEHAVVLTAPDYDWRSHLEVDPARVRPIRVWCYGDDTTFPEGVMFQGAFSV